MYLCPDLCLKEWIRTREIPLLSEILYSSCSFSTRGKREKKVRRSIGFRDRSVEKVGRRKQGHWHWPQPARERVSLSLSLFSLRSFSLQVDGFPPSTTFPSPPLAVSSSPPLLYTFFTFVSRDPVASNRSRNICTEGRGVGEGRRGRAGARAHPWRARYVTN